MQTLIDLSPYEIIDNKIDQEIYHPVMEHPSYKDPQRREKIAAYHAEIAQKQALFQSDLLKAYHLQNHPKAEKAFQLAWELGHSEGYYEVLKHFNNFAELLSE